MQNKAVLKIFLSTFLIGSLLSCGRFSNKKDEAASSKSGDRIVCVSKQINELLYALNAQKALVGVDVSSTYPPEIKKLTTVGYHRALGSEGIISLHPSAVWYSTHGIAPEAVVEQLKKVGIPLKEFPSTSTIAETEDLIRDLGKELDRTEKADSLCKKLDTDMADAKGMVTQFADTPRVAIIHYGQQMNIYLLVSDNSVAGKIMQWAGGKNCIENTRKMTPLSAEMLAKANPDVILLTDFGFDQLGTMDEITKLPGVSSTKAARDHRIYRVEEHDIIYLGPRTGENVKKFAELIHKK